MNSAARKKTLPMVSIIFLLLACIPREDPPEKSLYLEQVSTLPADLAENSGITDGGDLIWFINDSGNEPVIYGYNRSSNSIERKVVVKNMVNVDWEDITQNDDNIYIGDFGNNAGSRTDLKIISISKSSLAADIDTVVPTGIIDFSYEDQTDFTPAAEQTRYDCEAFIATNEKIYLFTKDWVDQRTRIYSLPLTTGDYSAEFIDEWVVEGLITAAAWSPEKKELYLLGYTPVIPFLWVYSDFDAGEVSYASAKRSDFFEFMGTQTEGLMINANGSVLISCEASMYGGTQTLFVVRER
jgi:hypothetical protein